MADSYDVVEAKRNPESMTNAVQAWLDDPDNPDSFGRTYVVKRGSNKLMIAIEYTTA